MAKQGVGCPHCGSRMTLAPKTLEKEIRWRGKLISTAKRYRQCIHCGHRWTTYELSTDEIEAVSETPAVPLHVNDDETLRSPRE